MGQTKMIISLSLVLVFGIFFHVLFMFADMRDAPHKAAIEFTQGYVAFDKAILEKRMCEESRRVDEVDVINGYIYNARQNAHARGFSLGCYIKNRLYHVKTQTVQTSHDKATVHLTAERKSLLRTFFSKGDIFPVDVTLEMVKQGGKWQVCGTPFPVPGV
jgi:hypothetical protein